ncbi:MAG: glycosyltransferase [Ruminococcus flavefaciens]|nr:glycosyltransferase [Ruminococcus flavefaciens]
MKIYQINVVCGAGSTGRIAVDLSKMISKANGRCRIAYGRGNAPKDVDSFKIGDKCDLYFHALMTRLTDRHGLYSKRKTRKLIDDICVFEPDIIHLHNIHGYYVNYELLFQFLEKYKKPVIWTMHDCWAFTGHCAHYESAGCEQWRKECKNCVNLSGYPATWNSCHVDENYNRKKKIFCSIKQMVIAVPSKWLREQLGQSFLKEIPCTVINNGIDLELYKYTHNDIKQRLGIGGKKLLLGVASVWTNNKGLLDMFKIAAKINEKYVICMVGLSKKQLKNIPAGIIGVERTESCEELAKYYSAADVFLNLTYEDTFPTTNIESLACGTPVITYRAGGSLEILEETCGIVVERGDIDGVINAIKKLESGMTRVACRTKATMYEKDLCYQKYLDLYRKMCKEER